MKEKLTARQALRWLPMGLRVGSQEASALLLADIARADPAAVADVIEAGCVFAGPAAARALIEAAHQGLADLETGHERCHELGCSTCAAIGNLRETLRM